MTDKLREEVAELLWNSAGPEITWQAYLKLADTGDAYVVGQIAFVREQADLVLPSIQRETARARAAALEEAAKVADGHVWAADCIDRASDIEWGGSEVAKEIAATIRALKNST